MVLKDDRDRTRRTRGHSKKVENSQCIKDVKKYSFPQKTVDIWNDQSDEVVMAASIHMFKDKLDSY